MRALTPEGPKRRGRKRKSSKDDSAEAKLEVVPAKALPPKLDEDLKDAIFKPNPGPQTDFLSAVETEVLYGGSAGGGKSYAMLADPLRFIENPAHRAILFRRTNDELRELKMVSQQLYPQLGLKWSQQESQWRHERSGATIWMTYLDRDEDVSRYQGQAFTWIGWDELTQWPTPYAFDYMRSRLRSADPYMVKHLYQRATTNPGGRGHQWVKKDFILPAPPNKPFWALDRETGEVLTYPEGYSIPEKVGKPMLRRRFIPASLKDNPYLADSGAYEANLLTLPEHLRKQLLEGSWDVQEGAAFPEFNRKIHVVERFDVPRAWPKFRACDYGYSDHTGVVWIAVAPDNQLVVYRELFVNRVTAVDLADMILEAEQEENIRYGVLDSSLWSNRGDTGPSLAEQMIRKGCNWRKADRSKGSRVAGKNEIHRLLQVDDWTGRPRMVFTDNCINLIAQLPSIPLDKTNPEDVDTHAEDHLYDALRYGVMSRPVKTQPFSMSYQQEYRPADLIMGY